ncbi:glycosyltransferase family 39 protein, partial [Hyella patelloides]|uniref:glycosyltransferase family 39 protein n=1 Tax=Hyella patelloides TaxID=1982969 RepID=UPI001FE4570B
MTIDSLHSDKQIYRRYRHIPSLGIIFLIWLLGIVCDRLWYSLDNSVPAWDQADYLNGALNYWQALQTPQWFDGEWWRNFWLLSNKIPPLHYVLTAPFFSWFGLKEDAANLVMPVYSAMLLVAVYGIGVILFNNKVGIYAAILCQLLPGLYYYRLEFLLDYPLTAITTFSFWLLTLWKVKQNQSWLLAIAFGVSLGFAVLLKQTALFFLFIPLVWLFFAYCKNRQWLGISQLITSIFISIAICYPWYRTNWLLILTSGKRATIDSAIAEGDPALNTIDAWVYYFKTLPYLLSWHLLLIPVVGIVLYLIAKTFKPNFYTPPSLSINNNHGMRWLLIYFIGGYLLSSFNINKDARYILPLLPIIALFLAIGLQAYSRRWRNYLQWLTIIIAIVLMLLNIFPLPGATIANILSPRVQNYPYTQQPYPHQEVIQEIINTDFNLRNTLGVLPSTPEINQHNFSFYGGLQNFQVVGRQVGIKENEVIQDMRSLEWFLTKTGDQGSVPEAQATITKLVSESADFQLHRSWQLPDNSELKLYRATQPNIEVAIPNEETYLEDKIQLSKIIIPQTATTNTTIPVTYQWIGSDEQLTQGIVLLTWQLDNKKSGESVSHHAPINWIHDRGIGMGMLASKRLYFPDYNPTFKVTENTAMLVPENITPGEYKLQATYLNRQTKESYSIPISETTITINANAKPIPAPELDLVTQLRTIAPTMSSGITALEAIFAQTARINQYDGKQDYLKQTELALSYRLQNSQPTTKQKLDWLYAIALSQVLQQDVKGAITSWQNLTQIAPDNPYNYAYLAFVYLYDWQ